MVCRHPFNNIAMEMINFTITTPRYINNIIFYYIGNVLEEKSGFREAYTAYMNTFNYTDNVAFIIAQDGAINTNQMNQVLESCDKSIGEIRNVNRKPVLKVVQSSGPSFSPQEKIALHVDGDCLVSPSYSISINSTVLESALYGGVPIINKHTSFSLMNFLII